MVTRRYTVLEGSIIAWVAFILIVFTVTIVCLALGLRNYYTNKYELTEQQKIQQCKDIGCKNGQLLELINSQCPASTGPITVPVTPATTTSPTTTTPPPINYRLPTTLEPYFYDIKINYTKRITEEPDKFDGKVVIWLNCVRDTNMVVLHIKDLEINNKTISIKGIDDSSYEVNNVGWVNDYVREFFVATLPQSLKSGKKYALSIEYTGVINNNNVGLYKSSYLSEDGRKQWLLATQMEATEARRMFPCFDEPAMKAIFNFSITHHRDFIAFFNTHEDSENVIVENELRQSAFAPSEPMSTYLVALVLADFYCVRKVANMGINERGTLIQVCAKPSSEHELDYALQVAVDIIEYFEKVYGVKYPLFKCDHVAIPDFAAGAMENFGLITYRESGLLYTENTTSQTAEQAIVNVIAHETAHLWFGDIVSPKWWNDLWLNEGFATYMAYFGLNYLRPQWEILEQFADVIFSVMQLDSVSSSHEISIDVNDPNEIAEIFDDITYSKGASLIRMINYFISSNTFAKGITKYLEKYKFQSATQDDLWVVLDEETKFDNIKLVANLPEIMNTWTKQMGHPVIHVKELNKNSISITQEHFLLDSQATASQPSPYDYKWFVPFSYSIETINTIKNSTFLYNISNLYSQIEWLTPSDNTKTINLKDELQTNNFILANLELSGFYRINYEPANWNKIIKQLNIKKDAIPIRNRAQIIDDAFSLSRADLLDIDTVFDVIEHLSQETSYLPWRAAFRHLNYLNNMLESTSLYSKYQDYLLKLITPVYEKLGWEEKTTDTWLDRLLRGDIISFACSRGLALCVNKARSFYATWMNSPDTNMIPINYRSTVYCIAIKYGGEKEWLFASENYKKETDARNRNNLQYGMSCAKEPYLIRRFLDDQLDENVVKVQDALTGIRSAALNNFGTSLTWTFVKENWDILFKRYGQIMSFGRLISDLTAKLNTKSQLNEFVNFFKENPNQGSATREIKLSIDRINANINWLNKSYDEINKWLDDYAITTVVRPNDTRLPKDLMPYLYDIELQPYIGTTQEYGSRSFTFDGKIKIYFTCIVETDKIVFHTKELDIKNNTIKMSSSTDPDLQLVEPWMNDFDRQLFKMNFNRKCKNGHNYTLSLEYTGPLPANYLAGFYRSSYIDEATNQRKYLATTQFESTDARRAFPSFDEPFFKAEFTITIIRHKNFSISFGNMPCDQCNQSLSDPQWIMDKYQQSIKMPTYLVAFVVSNYEVIRRRTPKHNILIEVAAKPSSIQKGEGDYALDEAVKIMDYFIDYFGEKYPIDKSTQIAIPDFSAGAMENFGLITYRENALLYNRDTDTVSTLRRITQVVAHELVHQWFGNLVTMEWWSDIWLNEGFAAFYEYFGLRYSHPEWRDWESFYTQKLALMSRDSLESTRSIRADVAWPNEISAMFDTITYDKGACVIRMMNGFLTESTFQKGIRSYLTKNKFSNTLQDDLWRELDAQAALDNRLESGLTVKQIMDTWTLQKGYPVIHVQRRYNDNSTVLSQKWFLLNPLNKVPQSEFNKNKWYIPFSHTTAKDKNFNFEKKPDWLKPSESEKMIQVNAGKDDWVIGNLKHSGFYRVNYDDENWKLLIKQLDTDYQQIDEINRAALIDDAYNLAKAEMTNPTIFLDLVKHLEIETNQIPWAAAFDGLNYIGNIIFSCNNWTYSAYKKFYKRLVNKTYLELSWNTTFGNYNITQPGKISLQSSVMSVMCAYEDEHCVKTARSHFEAWKQNNANEIPVTYRSLVFQSVIRSGNEDDWYYLFDKLKNLTSDDQTRAVVALAYTKDFCLLKYLLSQTSNRNVIRSSDEVSVINAVSANSAGRQLAWEFFVENWESLYERLGKSSSFSTLVNGLLSRFYTKYELEKVQQLLNKYPEQGAANNAFKQSIENIIVNVRWASKNIQIVDEWLRKNRVYYNLDEDVRVIF